MFMNSGSVRSYPSARYLSARAFALLFQATPKFGNVLTQVKGEAIIDDTDGRHPTPSTPTVPKPAAFYRPELDALRFFAFFGVYICHTLPGVPRFYATHHFPYVAGVVLQTISRAGAYGVDLFFLLSSYLITELLLREKDATGSLDVLAFYKRRILRIWPLYFTFIGIGWALTFVDKTQQLPWSYIVAFLLLAGNWISAIQGHPHSVIAPLWSVSVEEQFYLLWPLLVRKTRTLTLAAVACAMLAVSPILRVFFFQAGWGQGLWRNSFTHLEPMALGVLIAVGFRLGVLRPLSTAVRTTALLVGMACWLMVAAFLHLNTVLTGTMLGYPLMALGSAAILLSWLGSSAAVLRHPVLIYLGKISYGLYVFHTLAMKVGVAVLGSTTSHFPGFIAFWLFSLATTIAMASISYFALERPFLRLKSHYTHVPSRSA
jgi:peptidoglycan/LPS O-acetylase OafA/YrhL